MTLIELLVVISIIGVLAGLLLPVLGKVKMNAKITQTKKEMADIKNAVTVYQTDYSRLPSSSAANSMGGDYVYGTQHVLQRGIVVTMLNGTPAYEASNAELMLILTGQTSFPFYSTNGVNAGNAKNPRKLKYLNAKSSSGNGPGLGTDGVFRDPWENPYIVTLDLNYDNFVAPALYRLQAVSQETVGNPGGYHGLISRTANGAANDYSIRDTVAVWSMGTEARKPGDLKFDATLKAIVAPNADNVLSW